MEEEILNIYWSKKELKSLLKCLNVCLGSESFVFQFLLTLLSNV